MRKVILQLYISSQGQVIYHQMQLEIKQHILSPLTYEFINSLGKTASMISYLFLHYFRTQLKREMVLFELKLGTFFVFLDTVQSKNFLNFECYTSWFFSQQFSSLKQEFLLLSRKRKPDQRDFIFFCKLSGFFLYFGIRLYAQEAQILFSKIAKETVNTKKCIESV